LGTKNHALPGCIIIPKVESLIIAESFSTPASAPADTGSKFGGGDFGGGGSGDGF
jgi:hypothetical protein